MILCQMAHFRGFERGIPEAGRQRVRFLGESVPQLCHDCRILSRDCAILCHPAQGQLGSRGRVGAGQKFSRHMPLHSAAFAASGGTIARLVPDLTGWMSGEGIDDGLVTLRWYRGEGRRRKGESVSEQVWVIGYVGGCIPQTPLNWGLDGERRISRNSRVRLLEKSWQASCLADQSARPQRAVSGDCPGRQVPVSRRRWRMAYTWPERDLSARNPACLRRLP